MVNTEQFMCEFQSIVECGNFVLWFATYVVHI